MHERYEAADGKELCHSRLYMALALAPFLGTVAAFLSGLLVDHRYFIPIFHSTIAGLVATLWVWRNNPGARVVPRLIRASEEGLQVGEQFIARRDLKEALVIPEDAGKPLRVRVAPRGLRLPLELVAGDAAESRRLLRALGFDASQSVVRFRTLSKLLSDNGWILALIFGVTVMVATSVTSGRVSTGSTLASATVLAGLIAFAAALAIVLLPTRLSVGADGLVLAWAGRKRFLGYGDIDFVATYDRSFGRSQLRGVEVFLKSGETVKIPIEQGRSPGARVAIIEERIAEAMESFRAGDTAGDAAMLARGGRTASAWVEKLRSIGAGANAGPRTAPLARDRLFRIVEDPQAKATDRVAAAVALSAEIGDRDRDRLRVAAEAVAAPRLRVAIEAAAGDDGARSEEILAEIEVEESRARAQPAARTK